MKAIYKREVKSYFLSMTGYIFLAAVVLFMGIYFMVYNLNYGYPYFGITLGSLPIVLMFAVPILTMRSMADERHSRTDQMLLTAPVTTWSMILGKYFAMMTVSLVACAIFATCPLLIAALGTYSYPLADYSTLLCFFLLSGVYIAIGMFVSTLTDSQVIAAVGTFVILLMLQFWSSLIDYLPTTASSSLVGCLILWSCLSLIVYHLTAHKVLSWGIEVVSCGITLLVYLIDDSLFDSLLSNLLGKISVMEVFQTFYSDHLFDVAGLVYYISISFVLLFLTVQTVEKRRWS